MKKVWNTPQVKKFDLIKNMTLGGTGTRIEMNVNGMNTNRILRTS